MCISAQASIRFGLYLFGRCGEGGGIKRVVKFEFYSAPYSEERERGWDKGRRSINPILQ